MKNTYTYLLFTISALFFLGACSNSSKMVRVNPGQLQVAQTSPQDNQGSEVVLSEKYTLTSPEVAGKETKAVSAPSLTNPMKLSFLKKSPAGRILQNKIDNTTSMVNEKVSETRIFKKVTAGSNKAMLEKNLKIAIILIVLGLLLGGFYGYNRIFGLIGAIFITIGLIVLLVWLLDSL